MRRLRDRVRLTPVTALTAWLVVLACCAAARALGATDLATAAQFVVVAALYAVGRALRQRWALAVGVLTAVLGAVSEVGGVDVLLLVAVGAVLLGGSHATRAAAVRELAARQERTRIARELHDVVAHHMSVLAVQAETAPYRLDVPAQAAAEFTGIAEKARSALDEMRELLGLLRSGEIAPRAPQPTLHDVDALIESVRRAGTPVEFDRDDAVRDLEPLRALSVYRIVQESTSNALKHAAGQPLRVRIVRENSAIRVQVRNRVDAPPGPPGQGIAGMRERIEVAGGEFRAGRSGAEFVVDALIPGGAR